MNIISTSYGNDSCALIQQAYENELPDVEVVYINTGWAGKGWIERVIEKEEWVKSLGFKVKHINPLTQFESLIRFKKGFPNQRYQWCSLQLKAIPFLEYMDKIDPNGEATILIGKRREESKERNNTPEYIEQSEFHGNRCVWHPLYKHSESMRDELLNRAGIEPLPHRSQECAPCVNANRFDLTLLTDYEIERVSRLEKEVNKTMFRPKRHMGAQGIKEVIEWAKSPRGKYCKEQPELECMSGYCGL